MGTNKIKDAPNRYNVIKSDSCVECPNCGKGIFWSITDTVDPEPNECIGWESEDEDDIQDTCDAMNKAYQTALSLIIDKLKELEDEWLVRMKEYDKGGYHSLANDRGIALSNLTALRKEIEG